MATFDPLKVSTIIQVINTALVDRATYRIACTISESEYVELEKHFNIKKESDIQDLQLFTFSKKK